jgi:hypothetical protein
MSTVRDAPLLMRTAMLALAVLCVVMSLFLLTGWQSPWLVGAAARTLSGGKFGFPVGL